MGPFGLRADAAMYNSHPMKTPFFAPDAFRSDDVQLRAYRPGDGEALREATLSSYERLRVASAHVAEKRGMIREATFRSAMLDVEGRRCDVGLYAILKGEWRG